MRNTPPQADKLMYSRYAPHAISNDPFDVLRDPCVVEEGGTW